MPVNLDITPLLERAQKIGLRQVHLAEFAGLSVASVNRACNHVQDLSYQDFRLVEHLLLACEAIAARAKVPVSWKDGATIKKLLEAYETELQNPPKPPNEIDIEIFRRFVDGDDLDAVSFDFKISKEDILRRIELINARAEHIARIAK